MPQRVARLLPDPGRIRVRDPDEDGFGACSRAAQVLEMSVVEGLEAPVNHSQIHIYSTVTPAPSSTRPMRRMKSLRAANSASSAGARSAGTDTKRPPAVCGSYPSASSVLGS